MHQRRLFGWVENVETRIAWYQGTNRTHGSLHAAARRRKTPNLAVGCNPVARPAAAAGVPGAARNDPYHFLRCSKGVRLRRVIKRPSSRASPTPIDLILQWAFVVLPSLLGAATRPASGDYALDGSRCGQMIHRRASGKSSTAPTLPERLLRAADGPAACQTRTKEAARRWFLDECREEPSLLDACREKVSPPAEERQGATKTRSTRRAGADLRTASETSRTTPLPSRSKRKGQCI